MGLLRPFWKSGSFVFVGQEDEYDQAKQAQETQTAENTGKAFANGIAAAPDAGCEAKERCEAKEQGSITRFSVGSVNGQFR